MSRKHSAAWWTLAVTCALIASPMAVMGNVHTVFTTECGTYFVWQALGGSRAITLLLTGIASLLHELTHDAAMWHQAWCTATARPGSPARSRGS
jgi:hypothetical protein